MLLTCQTHLNTTYPVSLRDTCVGVRFAYRSRGVPWPLWLSVSVGDHSVAAYPAGPELQDSPSADSPSAQTVPNASCSACRDTRDTGIV